MRMKLHWSPRSPFVRKVMILAHETDLIDRLECVRTVVAMTTANAALLPENPLGKIPTLVLEDGTALYDSGVICEYLDGLHNGAKLFPPKGPARWTALRRQALGDGFLDLLILWRYERELQSILKAFDAIYQATMHSLEQEASSLASTPFGIGHIAIGCSLSSRFSILASRLVQAASADRRMACELCAASIGQGDRTGGRLIFAANTLRCPACVETELRRARWRAR
jgi:glutathione S-transferase